MASPRTPSLWWRAFVVVGGGTVVACAYNDAAWEKWEDVMGDAVPRETFRTVANGSIGLHVLEAAGAYFGARRAKLDKPGRWALSALLWGFPVHRRLSNERRALKSLEKEEAAIRGATHTHHHHHEGQHKGHGRQHGGKHAHGDHAHHSHHAHAHQGHKHQKGRKARKAAKRAARA